MMCDIAHQAGPLQGRLPYTTRLQPSLDPTPRTQAQAAAYRTKAYVITASPQHLTALPQPATATPQHCHSIQQHYHSTTIE